jgi:hypothetical protein
MPFSHPTVRKKQDYSQRTVNIWAAFMNQIYSVMKEADYPV